MSNTAELTAKYCFWLAKKHRPLPDSASQFKVLCAFPWHVLAISRDFCWYSKKPQTIKAPVPYFYHLLFHRWPWGRCVLRHREWAQLHSAAPGCRSRPPQRQNVWPAQNLRHRPWLHHADGQEDAQQLGQCQVKQFNMPRPLQPKSAQNQQLHKHSVTWPLLRLWLLPPPCSPWTTRLWVY